MFQREVGAGIEIRQFEMSDAEPLFELVECNREYLWEWMPWVDGTRAADDVGEFILRTIAQMEANQGPQCAIWMEGAIIGTIGCHPIDWSHRQCSMGYGIDASLQGRGIVTRCCRTMLQYLFGEMALHRVEIRCGTGNTKSCAIPERLGFTREGVARVAEWVGGRWVDLVIWSMLEGEWARVSGELPQPVSNIPSA